MLALEQDIEPQIILDVLAVLGVLLARMRPLESKGLKLNVRISSKSLTNIDHVIETVSKSLMQRQSNLKGKICQYLIK